MSDPPTPSLLYDSFAGGLLPIGVLAILVGYVISFVINRFVQTILCITTAVTISYYWYAIPHWSSVLDSLRSPGAGFYMAAIFLWSIVAFGISLFVALVCQSRRQKCAQHDG